MYCCPVEAPPPSVPGQPRVDRLGDLEAGLHLDYYYIYIYIYI